MGFHTVNIPNTGFSAPAAIPPSLAVVEYLLSQLPPLPPLNKNDYELVEFWDKKDWKCWTADQREGGSTLKSGAKGGGINSSWMEDENGVRVDISRQTQIITGARVIWITLTTNGVALTSYRGIDERTLTYFRRKVETDFEELRLCSHHWKADMLWMENFSSWSGKPDPGPKDTSGDTLPPSAYKKVSVPQHNVSFSFSCFRPV